MIYNKAYSTFSHVVLCMNDHISFIGVIVSFFAFPFIFCYPIMLMLYLLNSLSKTIFPGMLIVLTFHVAIFNCCRLFSFITSRVSLPSGSTPATSEVVLPVGFGTVPS